MKTLAKTLVMTSAALAGTLGIAEAGHPGCTDCSCGLTGCVTGNCDAAGCVDGRYGVGGCANGRCAVGGRENGLCGTTACPGGRCGLNGCVTDDCGPNGCSTGVCGTVPGGYGHQHRSVFGTAGRHAAFQARTGAGVGSPARPRTAAGTSLGDVPSSIDSAARRPFRPSGMPSRIGYSVAAQGGMAADPCADGRCDVNAAPPASLAGRPQPTYRGRW